MCLYACVYFSKKRVHSFHQIFKRVQYPKEPKDYWPGEFLEIQQFLEYLQIIRLQRCISAFMWSLTSSSKRNNTKDTIGDLRIFRSCGSKARKNLSQQIASYPNPSLHSSVPCFSRRKKNLFLPSSQLTEFYLLMPPASF